jgi:hypothetical protein
MVPGISLCHAATVGMADSTSSTSSIAGSWWDWPLGATVAGVAGAACASGDQLYGGWAWRAMAACACVLYLLRGVEVRHPLYNRVLCASLILVAIFTTTLAVISVHVGLALLAGPMPCWQSLMGRLLATASTTRDVNVADLCQKPAPPPITAPKPRPKPSKTTQPTTTTPSSAPNAPSPAVGSQTAAVVFTPWQKLDEASVVAKTAKKEQQQPDLHDTSRTRIATRF